MGDAQLVSTPVDLASELEDSGTLSWATIAAFDAEEIECARLKSGWSIKALVAHTAFWDDYQRQRMEAALAGTSQPAGFARPLVDNDSRAQEDSQRPWAEVEQDAKAARWQLVTFARNLPPDSLTQHYQEGDHTLSILKLLQHMVHHLQEHRAELQRYAGSLERWGRTGLRQLMVEQHDNLMNGMSGLTEKTMVSVPVCGDMTIRDVYAHLLSWHQYCAKLLRFWPQPDPESISEWDWLPGDSMDTMNTRLMAARAHLTMIEIADSLETEHRRMLRAFDRKSDADLSSEGLTWGGPEVLSNFIYEIAVHEAEHTAQIWAFRAAVARGEVAREDTEE